MAYCTVLKICINIEYYLNKYLDMRLYISDFIAFKCYLQLFTYQPVRYVTIVNSIRVSHL